MEAEIQYRLSTQTILLIMQNRELLMRLKLYGVKHL